MKDLDLTPTNDGFANIAKTFAASILGDVKVSRKKDAAALLDSLLETVAYLAVTDPALVTSVRDFVKKET